MQNRKIAIISHVNPFSSGSGQQQRVFNTLLAVAKENQIVYLYTINEFLSSQEKVDLILSINPNFKIIYVSRNHTFLKLYFNLFFILGFGKKSNGIIPYIFAGVKEAIKKEYFDTIIFEYFYLYKLAQFLKTENTLLICDTHDILSSTFKELLAQKKWIPKFYKKFLATKYFKLEFSKALTKFDVLIAINKNEEQIFKNNFPNKRIYYIPMGIKFEKINASDDSKFRSKVDFEVIYYGGLSSAKNCGDALKVIEAVSKLKNNTIVLKIIGSNPSLFIKNQETDNVRVLGFIDNLETAFQNSDLAVIPFEGKYGFRSRIIELMYHQVPILTTVDGVWGMGFKDNDDIFLYKPTSNLSLKIEHLLKDFNSRKQIAKAAKQKVLNEFSFEQTYEKFAKII